MRPSHTRPATTRQTIFQRLYALAVVPYLLLALFGEGLHSHPLLAPDAGLSTAQSTLSAQSHSVTTASSVVKTSHLTRRVVHETAIECLACAWQCQSVAQTVAAPPLWWPSARALAPIEAHSPPLSFVLSPSRNRGPPLN